jgi:hypothetical protein
MLRSPPLCLNYPHHHNTSAALGALIDTYGPAADLPHPIAVKVNDCSREVAQAVGMARMGAKAPPGLVSEPPLSESAVRTTYDLLGSNLAG